MPLLEDKFRKNLATCFSGQRCQEITKICMDQDRLESMHVHEFMGLLTPN